MESSNISRKNIRFKVGAYSQWRDVYVRCYVTCTDIWKWPLDCIHSGKSVYIAVVDLRFILLTLG